MHLDCTVWKYERSDGAEPDTGGIQINKLKNNQEFFTDGASLKYVLSSCFIETLNFLNDCLK